MDAPLVATAWLFRHGWRVEERMNDNLWRVEQRMDDNLYRLPPGTFPLCAKITKSKYKGGVDTKAEVHMNKEIEALLKEDENENICGVIAAELLKGDLCVIVIKKMEHELFFFLQNYESEVSSDTIKALITKILNGLAWLHKHSIIHMDVKPENIMINNMDAIYTGNPMDSELRICDFGLSIWEGETVDFPRGTAKYIAPEGVMCQFEPKSDIWAVGVINFLLLTMPMACFPFKHAIETCKDFSYYKKTGKFKDNGPMTFDPNKDPLLKAMLCIDPKLRINAETARDNAETALLLQH